MDKVIVVEGLTDKTRIAPLIAEPVTIVCTNGTVSASRLEELLLPYEGLDIIILVDADKSGERLRKLVKREFPEARHFYINRSYKEVAATPIRILLDVLISANVQVNKLLTEG
ncbi:toprim domain-containing protein [Planococcus shenhongbingii]|uniref:Toprim domain-containing protein n=1 Tax=Planococcus shenhongbingii TaxID=3058398 RepID=A0ABT8NHP3_9BACL|nr:MULTISPECIES: toprim domain-containing protein [unclassified Planococcus (in: firmicutes)]MDN7247249.1 toprim domain-containing protein [Planococcus sp. N017]WKA59727.1 toprim domain-containing protein [Planococcus sp. N016]